MTPQEAVDHYGSVAAAARALNLSRSTFRGRLDGAKPLRSADNVLAFPSIPDRREPIDKLLQRRGEHFDRIKLHREVATWQQIHVGTAEPIALAFVGDPHLDDDGCNWRALVDDIAYLRNTPGMYAINIGDTTNNWVGRLARLFGNQETSQTSARQLAEWFLTGAGIQWAAVILGNHDQWNEGGEIIERMASCARAHAPVHDWLVKFELVFKNGATCRINAAHDFKGRSMYSPLHGLKKEAIWFQNRADILAAGHIHYGGIEQLELPGGHNPWLIRARGYKDYDSHALVNGFHEGQRFRSPVAIIDPAASPSERVTVFATLKQGAEYLTALRASRAKTKTKTKTKPKKATTCQKQSSTNGRRAKSKRSRKPLRT